MLFHRPQQEKDWTSLAALAKYVVDAANGVATVKIAGTNAADELRGAVLLGEQRSDLGFQGQLVIGSHVFNPGDRLLTPLASLTADTTEVRSQRAAWTRFPLSEFGEKLRANIARNKHASVRSRWEAHQAWLQDEDAMSTHNSINGYYFLLAMLAYLVFQHSFHEVPGYYITRKSSISTL